MSPKTSHAVADLYEREQPRVVTYRCRLFQKREVTDDNLLGVYSEVWDTQENPMRYDLPPGRVVKEVTDQSREVVREQISEYRKEHNIYSAGYWNMRGSL